MELIDNFGFEIIFIILIIVSIVNYILKKNIFTKKIHNDIFNNSNLDKLFKVFSYIGNNYKENSNDIILDKDLDQIYENEYRLYLTGNEKIRYMIFNVFFDKKHDLVTSLLFNKIWKEKDNISVEINLNSEEIFGVFAIVKEISSSSYLENNLDVKHLGKFIKNNYKFLNIYGNNKDLNEEIFKNKEITNFLEKYSKYIDYIHVSNKLFNVYRGKNDTNAFIKMKINLEENGNKNLSYSELIDFLCNFVNFISKFKFSKNQNANMKLELNELEKFLNKEDEAEKKNKILKELREKKERKIKEMSPRSKAKYLEKEERKFKKNKLMKVMKK